MVRRAAGYLCAFAIGFCFTQPTMAAENGTGFYLLGSRGPLAGFLPPPGTYFQNDVYIYSGSAGANVTLPLGNNLVAGVKGSAVLELPTVIWVTNAKLFGGSFALAATQPFGNLSVDAKLSINPLGSRAVKDSTTTFGDPIFQAMLGWNEGDFHWTLGALVNVPVGDYDADRLANVAFHHWGVNAYGSLTWLNPATGIDVSVIPSFTFNAENPATDYKTGTEFQVEWAVSKSFTKEFSLGFIGYHYQQITGDSGEGAVLGAFKGRTTGLGGTIGYNFALGHIPVSTRVKIFQELDTKNRLKGTAGFITISMPLGVAAE